MTRIAQLYEHPELTIFGPSIPDDHLGYLGTPYSKYPEGIEFAFREAARLAAHLLRCGCPVYSPIAHTHPLAIHGNIDPYDHEIWLGFDRAMMLRCDYLIVAQMKSWEISKGLAHEIEFFKARSKPVYLLDPVTMNMRHQRPPSPEDSVARGEHL
jgi:Domain of unknown function (DUF1937)